MTSVVTEDLSGWGNANYSVSEKNSVSKELSDYLNYIKNKLKDNVDIVSVGTGPDRKHSFNWDK